MRDKTPLYLTQHPPLTMRNQIIRASVALLASLVYTLAAYSDHHEETESEPTLARGHSFEIKAGSQVAFQKAFAKHVQWRRDNKDPWGWECYVIVNGPEVGRYVVRSYPHTWADFDDYYNNEFGQKALEHWNANVAPHLASENADISDMRWDLSKWTDERDYEYFLVNTNRLKIGKQWYYLNAIQQISDTLKEANWEGDWLVDVEKVGGNGNTVWVVFPFENFAGMEEPSPDAYAVFLEVHGQEKTDEVFGQLNDAIANSEANLYRHLPDHTIVAAE